MLASPRASQPLLADAIDSPVPHRAVQVAAAARGGRGRHALSVVAGFRIDAVAVLIAARHRAPLLADADLADFPSLAVFMAGALHGAMAVPALVRVQALRLPVGPRLRAVALAIAEGVELAGARGAGDGPPVRGRRGHALEAVGAIEGLRAGVVPHLLLQLALALACRQRARRGEQEQPHWNTSRITAARPSGSSTG